MPSTIDARRASFYALLKTQMLSVCNRLERCAVVAHDAYETRTLVTTAGKVDERDSKSFSLEFVGDRGKLTVQSPHARRLAQIIGAMLNEHGPIAKVTKKEVAPNDAASEQDLDFMLEDDPVAPNDKATPGGKVSDSPMKLDDKKAYEISFLVPAAKREAIQNGFKAANTALTADSDTLALVFAIWNEINRRHTLAPVENIKLRLKFTDSNKVDGTFSFDIGAQSGVDTLVKHGIRHAAPSFPTPVAISLPNISKFAPVFSLKRHQP